MLEQFGREVMEHLANDVYEGPSWGARAWTGKRFRHSESTDLMLALYPGNGASYGPHIDNLDGDGRKDLGRVLSVVYYLGNFPEIRGRSWTQAQDGGALLLYPPARNRSQESTHESEAVVMIPPAADILVLFRADWLVHEVTPTHTPRAAATMWLFGQSLKM
mmetsp:Transcript_580/g.792  ORF Transcript_580/g.792 Transcript_580/m.792 type:complete len:162 (+) Transcript_580:288-773(+)